MYLAIQLAYGMAKNNELKRGGICPDLYLRNTNPVFQLQPQEIDCNRTSVSSNALNFSSFLFQIGSIGVVMKPCLTGEGSSRTVEYQKINLHRYLWTQVHPVSKLRLQRGHLRGMAIQLLGHSMDDLSALYL